jgi:hypothetical protein
MNGKTTTSCGHNGNQTRYYLALRVMQTPFNLITGVDLLQEEV